MLLIAITLFSVSAALLHFMIHGHIEVRAELSRQVHTEKRVVDSLLLNILPRSIVSRLKEGEDQIVDEIESATVLFADIVGFTSVADIVGGQQLIASLNRLFSSLDAITMKHGVEKIKTIGDAYMVAAGVPEESHDHA